MSFPKYPAYKDSGVEWLGEVPEHWATFSLKRSVDGCTNGLWGDEPNGENDLAVIRVADFDRAICRVGLDKLTYRSITQKERDSRLLKSGDLLIEKSGGGERTLVGCVVLFEHDFQAITSNFVARMRPLPSFDSGFLCYAFDTLYQGKVNYPAIKQTTGIQNLDSESYLQERFCFPTLAEQTQIARFLDHETARIDALIEEQQRLIELLKEKRQAVISHAVTKGLDPTVPMKDSGVEWLGEVPAHWEVGKVRYFAKLESGHTPSRGKPEYWENCTVPWFSLADVWQIRRGEVIEISETKELVSELGLANSSARLLPKGTVVLSRTASVGYSAIMGCDMATTQDFANWICGKKLINTYLLYCFRAMTSEFYRLMIGSTHKTIYMPDIAELVCPVPPLDEQENIAKYISHNSSNFREMVKEAECAKGLLTERRSALISAAVTGKIDVRGWQLPASENMQ